MKPVPRKRRATELCLVIAKDGIRVYANSAAFESLADWMSRISASKPSEHYEFHMIWHLLSFAKKPNVFVLVDRAMGRVLGTGGKRLLKTCELTFMAVEQSDLRALRKYQRAGVLPKGWSAS